MTATNAVRPPVARRHAGARTALRRDRPAPGPAGRLGPARRPPGPGAVRPHLRGGPRARARRDEAAVGVLRAARLARHRGAGAHAAGPSARPARCSLLDVKRGDIGSTMQAYADAYADPASPLAADALTVTPYLGYGSLRPVLDLALANGLGVFVLALTSNPEGRAGAARPGRDRHAASPPGSRLRPPPTTPGRNRWARSAWSSAPPSARRVRELGLDLAAVNGPILAPGLGAQGGTAADLREVFGAAPAQRPGEQQPGGPERRAGPRVAARGRPSDAGRAALGAGVARAEHESLGSTASGGRGVTRADLLHAPRGDESWPYPR